MSYSDGMAAMRLEMPDRVPRTEYSAENHWELVKRVTGIDVDETSASEKKKNASSAFIKAWNYDFLWAVLLHSDVLDKKRTRMGHAVYAAGGTDYSNEVFCPFESPEEALEFDPAETYGPVDQKLWIEKFNNHYDNNKIYAPEAVNMTGTYITCMSGLIEIFGWDILLCAAGLDPDGFGRMTERYVAYVMPYFEALAKSKAPIVMVHDDIVWSNGPFLHPDWYRRYLFPSYQKLFVPLHESGKKIMYTSDGNYTQFLDDIAQCGVHGFVMEPLTDMGYLAEKYGQTHVMIGNADTRVLLNGDKEEIYGEVKRCMDIGKKCPGFFMAVGNHIPANTPVESALWYNEAYEYYSKR